MLSGWYCRSMANMQANSEPEADDDRDGGAPDSDDDSRDDQVQVDYKAQYHSLKRKLKFLLYENESFQSALQSCQRRHLKVARDRSFLLDRLLQYEKLDPSSSESDETESSEDEINRTEIAKRKRENSIPSVGSSHNTSAGKTQPPLKKKKPTPPKQIKQQPVPQNAIQNRIESQGISMGVLPTSSLMSDGHMTPEEVERHLQSRQSYMELVPEHAPPTVPTELFSNDPSLDSFGFSESNDLLETSPSNIGEECLSIDMNMTAE